MFLASCLSDIAFIMLINIKMPTIVGFLTFMSRINFVLSLVEYKKSFITLGPGFLRLLLYCSWSLVGLQCVTVVLFTFTYSLMYRMSKQQMVI